MKKFSFALPMSLGRAAAELSIIVLGVLIALGAQSWWESRQRDEDRERALASVASDLGLLEVELAADMGRADSTQTAIRWILSPDTDIAGAPDDLYTAWTRLALWEISGARPSLPAYEDLKGSGRLGLLPDTVRSDLARLDEQLRSLNTTSDDNFQYQIRNLDPWLLENAPLRSTLSYDDELRRDYERFDDGVLRSRRVENMLLAKLELIRGLETIVKRVDTISTRLRESVRDQMEPGS